MKVTYKFPFIPPSLNQVWKAFPLGQSWRKTRITHPVEDEVHAMSVEKQYRPIPQEMYPVREIVTACFPKGSRRYDNSNILIKTIEDALRRIGLLENDSPEYIAETTIRSVKCAEESITFEYEKILPKGYISKHRENFVIETLYKNDWKAGESMFCALLTHKESGKRYLVIGDDINGPLFRLEKEHD